MSAINLSSPSAAFRYFRPRPLKRVDSVPKLERAFAWLAISVYGGALTTPLRVLRGASAQVAGESDPVMAACQTALLGMVIYAFTMRPQRLFPLLRYIRPFLILLGLCFVSVVWSDIPGATLRRSATLGICLLYGTYCFDRFGASRMIEMVLHVMISLGVLSVIVFVAVPSIGHETAAAYAGAMRGVFSQKNGLAECMLLGISCGAYRFLEERRVREFMLATPLLFGCIVLSASATSSMIAGVVLLVSGYMYLRGQPRARALYAYAILSTVMVLASVLIFAPDAALGVIGRDTTLTGRLPLWQAVITVIEQRPFLGHGYSGFWDASTPAVQDLWARAGWEAPDAHNGYLDIMIQLGVLGAIFYVVVWGRIIYLAVLARKARSLPIATWVILFMLINVLVNMDEGPLPWADAFTLVMPTILIVLGVWNEGARQIPAEQDTRRRAAYLDLSLPRPADSLPRIRSTSVRNGD